MNYLWKLTFRGGEEVEVPEDTAARLRQAIARGEKFYSNPVRTFAIDQIKSLEKTSKVDTAGQKLLADAEAALAGDKPILVTLPSGEVAVKALTLKRQITKSEWEKVYSKDPCYDRVNDGFNEGEIWIKYTRPAHLGVPPGHVICTDCTD